MTNLAKMQADMVKKENKSNNFQKNFLDSYVRFPDGDGSVLVRILPAAPGRDIPYVKTRIHTLDNGITKRNLHCPKEYDFNNERWTGKCVVCDYYSALWRQAENQMKTNPDQAEETKNDARKLKPIERFYYNAIQRERINSQGKLENNVGPLILSVGKTVNTKILMAYFGNELTKVKPLGNIEDLKTGRDFLIVRMMKGGKSGYPEYGDSKFEDISPAGTPEECAKWMENLHDLEALRIIKPYDEMKHYLRVYLGLEEDNTSHNDFDMSEFQQSVTPPVAVKKVQESAQEKSEDVFINDDEFFADLNSIPT